MTNEPDDDGPSVELMQHVILLFVRATFARAAELPPVEAKAVIESARGALNGMIARVDAHMRSPGAVPPGHERHPLVVEMRKQLEALGAEYEAQRRRRSGERQR